MLRLLLDIITCRAGGFIQMCWLVRRFSFFLTDRYSISNISKSDIIGRRNFFFFLSDKEEERHRVRIMMQIISMRMTKFFFSWILLATVQSNAPNSHNRLYTYAHVYKIYFYFVILSSIENRSPYIPIHHSSDFYCVYIINVKPECCSRSSICLCCIQSGFATTKNTHIRTQHNRWWWLSQRPSFSFRLLFKLLLLDYFKIQLVLRLYEYGIITSE